MNNELNEINKKNYKNLTPFKGWVIENFPFIEADFDAITNYQLICKVTEYLNTVIYNQNQVQDLSNELVNGYNNLLNYVNNYFDNLDVQEEINIKLDEMVQDGTLTTLIGNYVQPLIDKQNQEISNFEDTVNETVNLMNSKINSATSGSPLAASSTSEMTDTTRVYVNTTDGKWYYYNGTNWVAGGVYQGTSNQSQIDYFTSEIGTEYTSFTTTSTSSTVKNIMIPLTMYDGDKIEVDLITTSQNITKFAATAWTSDNQYKQIKSNLSPNNKYILEIPNDYSEYNRLQMYITTTATIQDTDINPYVKVYGELKNQCYQNTTDIENINSTVNSLSDEYEKQYGTYKTSWTRVYNTASSTRFVNTIDEIPQNTIVSFNIETTEEASNIQTYTLTFFDSNDQYNVFTGLHANTLNEIVCPRDTVKLGINITTLTELDPNKVLMTLNVYGNTNTKIYKLENDLENSLYKSKILIMGDSISTDSYANYKKWVTNLCDENVFNVSNVTNSSYHATGFVATYQEGGVVVSDTFYNRLTAIQNKSTYDIVITFGGINDYIQSIPWSDFTTAVDTYFDYLVKNFTQAKLLIISPLRTYNVYQNLVGKYQTEYDEYIRNKAKEYCLPVLNLTEDSGFYPFITEFRNMWTLLPTGYETHDGVHPNADYQLKYLAPMIKGFIEDKIYKN